MTTLEKIAAMRNLLTQIAEDFSEQEFDPLRADCILDIDASLDVIQMDAEELLEQPFTEFTLIEP